MGVGVSEALVWTVWLGSVGSVLHK